MRLILALGMALTVLAGTGCGCSCGGGPLVMDLLVTQAGGAPTPVGLHELVGVLIPGSGRSLTPSASDRVTTGLVDQQPDGSSLVTVYPTATAYWGKPFHFGGTIELTASTNLHQSGWNTSIEIGTDPNSIYDLHTYEGAGTTVMQVGQTFLMTWPVGTPAPASSDAAVLTLLGNPVEVARATQTVGQSTIIKGIAYMQQLVVAVNPGNAKLSAPQAFDPAHLNRLFGPSQQFIVIDDARWTCSPSGGCSTADAEENNSRPDRYYPAGMTPSA